MTIKIDNVNSQIEVGTPTSPAHVVRKDYADAGKLIAENAQSVDYQLVLSDANKMVTLTGATPRAFTVPDNATVAFPIGTTILFSQDGTGALTIAAGGGVTIKSDIDLTLPGQYTTSSIIKIGTDTWRYTGTSSLTGTDITTALGYTPVNVAGDTMTGALILNADPVAALGASTKQYVDTSQLILENSQSVDYQLVLSDAGKLVTLTGATPRTFTVPDNATVAFPIGTVIGFAQDGTGTLTLAAAGGVTIKYETSLSLNGQHATASLVKIDTDTWRLSEGNPVEITSGVITTALGYTPVDVAGDTMTGDLILNADPTVALGAVTKQYVDNNLPAEPISQIVYGTGTGIDSSTTFTYSTSTGALTFTPTANATPGDIVITSAANTSGSGSNINITGGDAGGSGSFNGGSVTIKGGKSVPAGNQAGQVLLRGGDGNSGPGGNIDIGGGVPTTGDGGGGNISIYGGDSVGTGGGLDAGFVEIYGGYSTGNGDEGGYVDIVAGGSDLGNGGHITLTAGDGFDTTSAGGSITFQAGVGGGSGVDGSIKFETNTTTRLEIDGTGAWLLATVAGTAGHTLTSNGAGTPPTWQDTKLIAENSQSDNYQLVLSDANKLITLTGAVAKTFTIPDNATVAFPIGTTISFTQDGTGQLDIAAAGGVTIKTEVGLKLNAQYAMASVIKVATDTWRLSGSLKV